MIRGSANQVAAADRSVLLGGTNNRIISNSTNAVLVGGYQNGITGTGLYEVICGGDNNSITSSADENTIGGGGSNNIFSSALASTISGGLSNLIGGNYSAIPGGRNMRLNNTDNFGFLAGSTGMTIATDNIATFGNVDLWLANNDNSARALKFWAPWNTSGAFPSTDKYVGIKAGAVTTSVTYILPLADATVAGSALTSDAAGNMGWIAPMSSVSAPATTGTMSIASSTSINTVVGIVPSGACTFNAPAGIAGQIMVFSITTSGTSSYNLNWNTNYKSTGTLATGTVTAKTFTVTFVCADGTTWHEISRTGAM
jgi:VCBS repeat-containing protein